MYKKSRHGCPLGIPLNKICLVYRRMNQNLVGNETCSGNCPPNNISIKISLSFARNGGNQSKLACSRNQRCTLGGWRSLNAPCPKKQKWRTFHSHVWKKTSKFVDDMAVVVWPRTKNHPTTPCIHTRSHCNAHWPKILMLAAPAVFKMKTTKIEKFHVHENQNQCNTRSGSQMFVFTVAVNIAKGWPSYPWKLYLYLYFINCLFSLNQNRLQGFLIRACCTSSELICMTIDACFVTCGKVRKYVAPHLNAIIWKALQQI